jgi:macrolide-specific efflux system membrane fusion protein
MIPAAIPLTLALCFGAPPALLGDSPGSLRSAAVPTSLPGLPANSRQAQISHCLVSLVEDVAVPAREAGAIVQIEVKEGQFVQAGTLLATIDDRKSQIDKLAAELERDAALAKASDDIEVRFSQAAMAVADAELERALAIERKNVGAVAAQEIAKLRLAKKRDELQIDRSKLEMRVAKMNADVHQAAVDAAEEGLQRRRIVSPIDGVVVTIYHEKGEWLNAGEPVLQVVRIDRLRVEGFLSASEYNSDEVLGRPVMVDVALAHGQSALFSGRVVYISPLVQAGNKFRVRAEVENRSDAGQASLRPGMTANMTIQLK